MTSRRGDAHKPMPHMDISEATTAVLLAFQRAHARMTRQREAVHLARTWGGGGGGADL